MASPPLATNVAPPGAPVARAVSTAWMKRERAQASPRRVAVSVGIIISIFSAGARAQSSSTATATEPCLDGCVPNDIEHGVCDGLRVGACCCNPAATIVVNANTVEVSLQPPAQELAGYSYWLLSYPTCTEDDGPPLNVRALHSSRTYTFDTAERSFDVILVEDRNEPDPGQSLRQHRRSVSLPGRVLAGRLCRQSNGVRPHCRDDLGHCQEGLTRCEVQLSQSTFAVSRESQGKKTAEDQLETIHKQLAGTQELAKDQARKVGELTNEVAALQLCPASLSQCEKSLVHYQGVCRECASHRAPVFLRWTALFGAIALTFWEAFEIRNNVVAKNNYDNAPPFAANIGQLHSDVEAARGRLIGASVATAIGWLWCGASWKW